MSEDKTKLAFGKQNYQLLGATLGVIILGLVIMSLDSQEFGFGFLGLTLGPVTLFLGFMLGFFAILYTPKSKK
jgi:tellurite resistance protein TehA-like permease